MNVKQKSKKEKGGYSDAEKVVIVAVRASKEIVRTPLEWALTNVALPGDCIKLLVVITAHTPDKYRISGRKLWSFSKFTSECTNGSWRAYSGTMMDQREDAAEMCSQMMCQLQDVYDPDKNKISIKVVSGSTYGVVAAEARKAQSNWVILDRHLKFERKCCMEELQCNVVVMKRSQPKVLRLNLVVRPAPDSEAAPLSFELDAFTKHKSKSRIVPPTRDPPVTPISSPDHETSLTTTDVGSSSISSSDRGASPFMLCGIYEDLKKAYSYRDEKRDTDESESDTDSDKLSSPSIRSYFQPWLDDDISSSDETPKPFEDTEHRHHNGPLISLSESLQEKFFQIGNKLHLKSRSYSLDHDICKNVRELTSFSRNLPSASPPLCSICQHKTPMFGKPPKGFTYAELELATSGFAQENFLAEGGYGSVYRGVLPDGQVVAVKQHKMASSQGDQEFCSEVEVLSCAQHRNVVMLIGFCVEDGRRLLVYEYICNGSLDAHLYGKKQHLLEWNARQKIGLGAARGLRYLHEECRVGCIVHRDMRPNNILVTHDFEPLVGDFGLARWQPDGDRGVETRVIGTFGYLAPEYAQTGHVTEKADVYSFGVVLVELITGRKAVDIDRPKGEQCLAEWARPLLAKYSIGKLIDPRLGNKYSEQEVYNMVHCASLCIKRDPDLRPRMSQVPHSEQHSTSTSSSKYFINSYKTHFSKSHFSQKVLRILEGDILVNATSDNNASISRYDSRSSSSRIGSDSRKQQNRYYCGQVLGNPTLSAAVSEGLSLARKHTKEHRGQFGGTESVLSRGRSLHKDQ